MRIYIGIVVLTFSALAANATTVGLNGLGNGQGWNDGSFYTGYATLSFDGGAYPGLCIDVLHEAAGTSWDALYIPLTDTAATADAMLAYFGTADAAVYLPKLYADMAGYAMLSSIGADKAANDLIQHAVWSQFAPDRYRDTGVLSAFLNQHPALDLTQFGLLVDADYKTGGHLEQAFLVNPHPAGSQNFFVTETAAPEPASTMLAGGMLLLLSIVMRKKSKSTKL